MKRIITILIICTLIPAFCFSQDELMNTLPNKAFLSKGVSSFGFRVGFQKKEVENDMLLTFVDIEQIKNTGADISLHGSWFIADNVAWGAKLTYGFTDQRYTVSSKVFNLLLDATKYNSNIASTSLCIGTGVKNYVPFGASNRFFVYNETNITYAYISSLTRDVYDDGKDVKKMMKTTHEISLGLSPGVMYFLKDGFAFEFALNPVMIYYTRSFITKNETINGSASDLALDFKFNLFKIYFGFAYYFGLSN